MDPIEPNLTDPETEDRKKLIKKGKKQMGFERVRLALERLQLAWFRTAITLTVFGFTIYRLLEGKIAAGRAPILGFITGREIGLFMLFIGFTGLVLSMWQHIKNNSKLKRLYEEMPTSVSLVMSIVMLAFCLFLFLVILFKL